MHEVDGEDHWLQLAFEDLQDGEVALGEHELKYFEYFHGLLQMVLHSYFLHMATQLCFEEMLRDPNHL